MAKRHLNYREVTSNHITNRWKEIDILVDTQNTLHDSRLPELVGGYAYQNDGANSITRHRFIYWKIIHDVLELTEQSLDYPLHDNQIRFRFKDKQILDCITIHETSAQVILFVATVSSVHRITFTHPNAVQEIADTWPSVFSEASETTVNENASQFLFEPLKSETILPHTSTSWLSKDGDAVFAIASHVDRMLIVSLPRKDSQLNPKLEEIRGTCGLSIPQRLWTGLVPLSIRGEQGAGILSLTFHKTEDDLYIYALRGDCKIRLWSCSDSKWVMMYDLFDIVADAPRVNGPQNHMMRKSIDSFKTNVYLGLYLCLENNLYLCVVQPYHKFGQHQFEPMSTIQLPECHLIDFRLTRKFVWALWSVEGGEASLHVTAIECEEQSVETWKEVLFDSSMYGEVIFNGLVDPREAFLEKMFASGNFSLLTICKVVTIYTRSPCVAKTVASLKEKVTLIIEQEIRSLAPKYEMNDEEYLSIQAKCWSKFYTNCEQYREEEKKTIGLIVNPQTDMIILIKKSGFSILRPLSPLELLFLSKCKDGVEPVWVYDVLRDHSLWMEFSKLLKCLKMIDTTVTEEMKVAFECDLFHRQEPREIVDTILEKCLISSLMGESTFLSHLIQTTNSVRNFVGVIRAILKLFDSGHGYPLDFSNESSTSSHFDEQLFASRVGCSLLAKSVQQIARLRFDVCRNLLFYYKLVIKVTTSMKISPEVTKVIEADLIPKTITFLKSSHVLIWASETSVSQLSLTTVESTINLLSTLNISDDGTSEVRKVKRFSHQMSLVELFIQRDGGLNARMYLTGDKQDLRRLSLWDNVFSPFATAIEHYIWPLTDEFLFCEFLLKHCQYIQLSNYAHLLDGWYEPHYSLRNFYLAIAHLNFGDPEKSLDYFYAASHNLSDDYMQDLIIESKAKGKKDSELTTYYLKVIELFEQFSFPLQIISVAKRAISDSEEKDENLPTLWCIIFKHYLGLGHYREAYEAIVKNSNKFRKKDCLRQLIVALCEQKLFTMLVEFPYNGLLDDVVTILESKARSVDLASNNFYDVLYSFHISRDNYRKAATAMYEYGMRLGNEVPGIKGLQQRVKCYLATINCLKLVDPNYAWIVKPVVTTTSEVRLSFDSPKRDYDGNSVNKQTRREIKLLELNAIEMEYELLLARLLLCKKDSKMSPVLELTISETVGLLINYGLFDSAFYLSGLFSLNFAPVFEGLTARCVEISRNSTHEVAGCWNWLCENDLTYVHATIKTNPVDHAWALLESYVKKFELKGQTQHHRSIATKLLRMAAPLPLWLEKSYKKRNAAELLRLQLDFDLIEDAAYLCIDYIDALLGSGREYFGLSSGLGVTSAPVWVPYTLIDHLLVALTEMNEDPMIKEVEEKLLRKLEEYDKHVEIVSEKMIELANERKPVNNL